MVGPNGAYHFLSYIHIYNKAFYMKLNRLKQIIKEEILKEIKVQPPAPLELIRVPDQGWELLVGNEYRTNEHSTPLQNYKELPGYVDDDFWEDDEFINLINSEPSFGGGASEAEIENSYNIWEDELRKIQNVLKKYNVEYEYRGDEVFKIPVDQIRNWSKIEIIDEIRVQAPGNYGITVDNRRINLFSEDGMLNVHRDDLVSLKELVIYDRNLKKLYCTNGQLTKLDLRYCPNLEELACDKNELTSLDLSNCPNLYVLSCGGNQLTSLDLSNCSNLSHVHCSENKLTSLNLSNCSGLRFLNCRENKLTSLDVSDCFSLKKSLYTDSDVQIIRNKSLNEIKVQGPTNHFFWINDAIEFFRNDNDIFKGSKIDSIIRRNIPTILDGIWDRYDGSYLEYEAEEGENYPKNKHELDNPNKYTLGVSDCEYQVLVKFLTPYISNWLKENGWEYDGETDDFIKDNRKVNMFDYIDTFANQDTDPRDAAYEDFYEYIDKNF